MAFNSVPLDMITAPNYYAALPDGRWTVTSPSAATLWFQLQIVDALGTRRYIVGTGATLTVTFQRADILAQGQTALGATAQSVVVSAIPHSNDRSLFSMTLTTQNVQTLVSGAVKYRLVEGANDTTWLQDYGVQKRVTSPGF